MSFFSFLFFFCTLFIISNDSEAQDTLNYEEEADTIIIHKDPIIIKREVIIQEEKIAGPFALRFFLQPIYYSNYYDVCSTCGNYLEEIKQASSSALSFSSGLSLAYLKKRIYAEVGISYFRIRQNFTFTDSSFGVSSKNIYNYVDADFLIGYRIPQDKLSFLVYAGAGISKLVSFKGYTLSQTDTALVELKKENALADYVQRGVLGLSAGYKISERMNFSAGPEYSISLRSVISRSHYYVWQRNMFGLKLSLLYFL